MLELDYNLNQKDGEILRVKSFVFQVQHASNLKLFKTSQQVKSSQVITLPIAKSQTRIQTKTCTAAVCIAGRKAPPDFDIGRRMSRCPRSKNATRVPPSLCNVTQTSDPADPPHEHAECAARVCVARDLQNSSWQAKYGLDLVARTSHRSRRSTVCCASPTRWPRSTWTSEYSR